MRRWVEESPVTMGVVLVALGFVFLFLGWNGAASLDHVSGQIPYVISGGLAGLALVCAGLCVVVVQSIRKENGRLSTKLDELLEAVREVGTAPPAAGPTAVPSTAHLVVAGRGTYHTPECRLVEGRADLQAMSPEAAEQRGLRPCRVCKPTQQRDLA